MANGEQLAIIRNGGDAWNIWRKNISDLHSPDLSGADLSGADLSGADLSGADLSGADLSGADLGRVNLTNAILRQADLRRSNLALATLVKANLYAANLYNAHIAHADLSEATLNYAKINTGSFASVRLRGVRFHGVHFGIPNFHGVDLEKADFGSAHLRGADLSQANLRKANFRGANLINVNLSQADLSGADLSEADFEQANLSGAILQDADLSRSNIYRAYLSRANLCRANLSGATLIESNFAGADLTGCRVYGTSVWNLYLDSTKQHNLRISRTDDLSEIVIDNIEIAQFVYLLTQNSKIRDVIDAITSKIVLILGRFTPERKTVLEALRSGLRQRNYIPILFDFDGPANRDIIETVSLLARMARFVLADITDAKGVLQELGVIVPDLPSVPVQPLLLKGTSEHTMFEHYTRYPWVLPICRYETEGQLLKMLSHQIIEPAERMGLKLRAGVNSFIVQEKSTDGQS